MKCAVCVLVFAIPIVAYAQWSGNATVNTPISLASSSQDLPQLISDGSGGAIITWVDGRNPPLNSNGDIYAQRIGANGFVQWAANGISVCSNSITQNRPQIVSDGSGGAIIVWEDLRNNTSANDIYAQRINSNGVIQWTANGIPVCTIAASKQDRPQIVSDGASGAIITWYDYRNNSVTANIYAQRIGPDGAALWTANGVPLCPATVNQIDPKLVADGSGGAIVVWSDNRTNTQTDVYAQRISSSGDIKWGTSAFGICVLGRQQWAPSIASDGRGGAIIAWADQRDTISVPRTDDVYVQRVDSNGNRLWVADGAPVSVGAGSQMRPIVLSYGDGGAIITWNDTRNGSSNRDIYAQRFGPSGSAMWLLNGVSICTASNDQDWANPISDGNGGAIVTWEDERAGGTNRHVYAQRVSSNGTVQWAVNGVAIGNAAGYKSFSQILPVGTGDGIITWGDERSGSDNRDIFAQRINSNGTLTSVRRVDEAPLSVTLEQNYPNPFNPSTSIAFSIRESGFVTLKVFNMLGQEVATLVHESMTAGNHESRFTAGNLGSGLYAYRLQTERHTLSRKLVLLR